MINLKGNLYENCGLLGFVSAIASHESLMNVPNWIPQEFPKSDKAFRHAVFAINWSKRLETETIPDLNSVRNNITELMTCAELDNQLWVNWLNYIDKVWMDFWIEDKENSQNGLKVLEYDEFFREQCLTRNVHMPKFLRQTPIERLEEREKRYTLSQTSQKAVCPQCGSNDTVSNGKFRILCNACGKQAMKSKVKQWITQTREEDEEY